ncbi:protein kinase [Nocardia sp. NPDC052566]|uniref:serine/threonine-protein kinase n=1 Tax=Nocardia sp. NPDC052566 TaxID=3364330 RepID=UPI0037C9AECB
MLRSGNVFAGYAIERQLGLGGMGGVYLARHPRLPRLTALKLLNRELSSDSVIRARFEREADLSARLHHPNIVTVYDRGIEDEQLWIAMQYVDGENAASGTFVSGSALRIITETAEALDYAHGAGVLHRDVKPSNILLARATPEQRPGVLLTDFGIARLLDDPTRLTRTGTVLATLGYASPEQLNSGPIDPRSDQYSLACTLFQLLTGALPFHGLDAHPRLATTLRPDLPAALNEVLGTALAKNPDDRYASCTQFAAAAAAALTPSHPRTPELPHTHPTDDPPNAPKSDAAATPSQVADAPAANPRRPSTPATSVPTTRTPISDAPPSAPGADATTGANLVGAEPRWVRRGVLAVIVAVGIALAGFAALIPGDSAPTVGASSVARPIPTPPDLAAIQEITQTFPAMLPHVPHSGEGYNRAYCVDATVNRYLAPLDDPGFAGWTGAWYCSYPTDYEGITQIPVIAYALFAYPSAAQVLEVLNRLPLTVAVQGLHGDRPYSMYQFTEDKYPPGVYPAARMLTRFPSNSGGTEFLMYCESPAGRTATQLDWWRAAPLSTRVESPHR